MTVTTGDNDLAGLPDDEQRRLAQDIARAEPDLSGPALAARFGKSERWGRNQRAAARAGTGHTGTTEHRGRTPTMPEPETGTPTGTESGTTVPPAPAHNTGTRHGLEAPAGTPVPAAQETATGTAQGATPALTRGRLNGAHQFPGGAREIGSEAAQTASDSAQAATNPASDAEGATADISARSALAVNHHGTTPPPRVPAHDQQSGTPVTGTRHDPHGDAGTAPPLAGTPAPHTGTVTAAPDQTDPLLLSALILTAMAAAMAWSWQHLAHLAVMAGATHGEFAFGPGMEWLLPISVDVLLVAGAWKARRLHTAGRRPGRATWAALAGAAAMSLGGNVISTLDMAGLTPPIDEWPTSAAVGVVVTVGLWMPAAAIVALEVLRDQGRPAHASPEPVLNQPNQ